VLTQIVIAICGILSIWFSQDPSVTVQRWACIAGLIGQPFWMVTTYRAKQWGIFALTFVYTIGWMRGIKTYWL
jgi:hypothetical protein